jgi:ABC-type Zn uptake system ZnuABC Zn-binding protein ZnuA
MAGVTLALRCVLATLLALGLVAEGAEAARKIRVVASLSDLKALTEAVGGELVEVDTLARGTQNPHDIEVRPSLMLKLRRADLVVRNGAGGDLWVEPLIVGAQNGRIVPGSPGYVDASRGVAILPPTGPVDRSRGDVHPEGNPHYTLDPALAPTITANIVEGLRRVAPEHGDRFEAQRREFLTKLQAAITRWQAALEPVRGARVVSYHETFTYFLRRFGLEQAGAIEDRPGIPPSPTHLAALIRTIREQKVRLIVAESFADQKVVELLARESGARAVALPSAVGGARGVDTYLDLLEHNVRTLAGALQ